MTVRHTIPTAYSIACSMALLTVLLGLSLPALASGLPTTSPGPHAAQISGLPGQVTQNLFEVRFVGIDGRNISPREVMWLEPGRYELTVLVDAAFVRPPRPGIRRSLQQRGANTIELELEAGKTYEIRGLYNPEQPADEAISVVLWRVTE